MLADRSSREGAEFEITTTSGEATRLRATKQDGGPVVLFPVPRGEWKVRASHPCHKDSERLVAVDDDEDEILEIEMEQDASDDSAARVGR